jgi:hypothetical protein
MRDLATAELLLSELVTNSVRHGPSGPSAKVGVLIEVERNLLRAEVSDGSPGARRLGHRTRRATEAATDWSCSNRSQVGGARDETVRSTSPGSNSSCRCLEQRCSSARLELALLDPQVAQRPSHEGYPKRGCGPNVIKGGQHLRRGSRPSNRPS